MDNGGQTADQVVRMTLQGIEVAAKVSMKVGEEGPGRSRLASQRRSSSSP